MVEHSSSSVQGSAAFQPHRRTSVGFRVGGGVHDSYTFQCGLVGSFTGTCAESGPTQFDDFRYYF